MKLKSDQFFNIAADPSEKKDVKAGHAKEYQQLKKDIREFNSIKSSATVPPYDEGHKG